MTQDERFEILLAACRRARRLGLTISEKSWGVRADRSGHWTAAGSCVCPLGALLLDRLANGPDDSEAAQLLAAPTDWVFGFSEAFDGWLGTREQHWDQRRAYDAGVVLAQRVRAALAASLTSQADEPD